jgi:ABC-2 type transport system permease protein
LQLNKIFAVAKWEFLGKIKTKVFIISVIITPLILVSLTIGGTLISSSKDNYTKIIGIADTSGVYFRQMRDKISDFKLNSGQPAYFLINLIGKSGSLENTIRKTDKDVINNKLTGYIVIRENDSPDIEMRSNSLLKPEDVDRFREVFTEVNNTIKLKKAGVGDSIISSLSFNTSLSMVYLNNMGQKDSNGFMISFFSSIIFIMLLITLIMTTGGMLVRSLVEEKSNKLLDIILSSCTPDELLSGKILGLSSVGFLQVLIWVIMSALFSLQLNVPLQAFENIYLVLVYFIMGFLLFTSIFVGIGSLLNTEQEAQQVTSYLSILMVFPVALALPALENPDFFLIKILSYFPLTLPSVMILRMNTSHVKTAEIVITLIILVLSILFTVMISARIFRFGILSSSGFPGLKQILEWIKKGNTGRNNY